MRVLLMLLRAQAAFSIVATNQRSCRSSTVPTALLLMFMSELMRTVFTFLRHRLLYASCLSTRSTFSMCSTFLRTMVSNATSGRTSTPVTYKYLMHEVTSNVPGNTTIHNKRAPIIVSFSKPDLKLFVMFLHGHNSAVATLIFLQAGVETGKRFVYAPMQYLVSRR